MLTDITECPPCSFDYPPNFTTDRGEVENKTSFLASDETAALERGVPLNPYKQWGLKILYPTNFISNFQYGFLKARKTH